MSAAPKNINTHVVDIFGSTKGRDQPIMKMDKAVELIKCLDKEVLMSNEYVFFDPFCKAGEILLAAALTSTLYRSNKVAVSQKKVAQELYESNRYFALAPDERHFYLSRRTFYGNERSHQKSTNNIRNGAYLSEEDGRLDQEKFKKEINSMLDYIKQKTGGNKKIIAVGNPPYQEEYKKKSAASNNPSKNIYNVFLEELMDSKKINSILLVIPARWYSGGRGLDKFRKKLFNSKNIKLVRDFEHSEEIFPTVDIKGGVCFFLYDKSHKGKMTFIQGCKKYKIDLYEKDFFTRNIDSYPILEKINRKTNKFVDSVIWKWNPFDLSSNYFEKNKEDSATDGASIKCLTKDRNRRFKFIHKEKIIRNSSKINEYKCICPKAVAKGGIPPRPDQFKILKKSEICTETFNVIYSSKNIEEAENFLSYLQTDFVRFLISTLKVTHDIIVKTWKHVPLMDMRVRWTDKKLYKYFGITKEEQKYIKEKVDYWTA